MLSFLTAGVILGLSAGFAPGPLLTLVVSETLQHGTRAAVKIALAPLLTDLPIILLALFLLAKLAQFNHILAIISIFGACFIVSLGIENFKVTGISIEENNASPKSLQKGILVNFLSPHPYLFWVSVGGPTTMKALDHNPWVAVSFIVSFYVFLVGSKIVLALLVGKSRTFLHGNKYIITMRLLGLFMFILAGFLFQDGLRLLGVL